MFVMTYDIDIVSICYTYFDPLLSPIVFTQHFNHAEHRTKTDSIYFQNLIIIVMLRFDRIKNETRV